ncbi:uncharacterized protein LOC123566703 [Mercenaria mercenaria]|uniref:uncharacterized protein LOC123566703 n=1 Tax=Mercenaria mercenaria TaxID=6596 RepID=UPI00234F6256|nr:uncharacterized protein LOC123566703 [Mercenaria mercenaria]
MSHQLHLEKEKYRQWVKAGLGLGYLKEGLAPFCDDVAKEQHKNILDNIKQTKNLPTVTCGQCSWRTLKPDHVKTENKQCPLNQSNCNCCYTSGKNACPNNVCSVIYDNIISNHASTPPGPNWKNTKTQQWTRDPWSIAKCFINVPGYEQKTSAADIDCTGLLHVIINNKYFHNHIVCNITGTDVFSKVRQYRNKIFHSSSMELEKKDASSYIDDMIAILEDGRELSSRQDSKDAVKKLKELKKDNFIITTKSEYDVVHAAEQSISDTIEEFENKLQEKLENVPTTEDVKGLLRRVTSLEQDVDTIKQEMKELKTARSAQKDQYDFIKSKLEFQVKLVHLYRKSLLQVSAIPLKPERKHCNFSEVYVRPRITNETNRPKDTEIQTHERNRPKDTEIQSMSDIFTKAGQRLKSIYILGDAGSGKSSFCKSLIHCWCMAHSGEPTVEDEFDGIKEMEKFEFMFYIALRRFKDIVSIKEMLEMQYKDEILNKILNKESRSIIIVLDGLDEWSSQIVTSNQFQTEGLPERETSKDYTVVTTSRPWKIETLGITDQEIEQRLKLQGFDRSSVKKMIGKTVPVLNEEFTENKSPSACEDKLDNEAIASMTEVPIMLLQLICLWFDDKLQVSSRCGLYSAMLELFFSWNDKKKKGEKEERLFRKMREMSKKMRNIELPKYLMSNKLCEMYKFLIHELSRLAYETLFTNEKEAFLTFENSVFDKLEISDEVKTCCLKLGILSEEGCPSLNASTTDSSLLSFVHKSVHEYLAAVYIAIEFKAHIGSSSDSDNPDLSGHCAPIIKKVFRKCTTLEKILEDANNFILLCGLEPRIATSISKYIYDIVTRDKRVLDYRRIIKDAVNIYRPVDLILNVQECILNCIEEVQSCHTTIPSYFYVGDIVAVRKPSFDHLCTCIDKQYISPDSVRSFTVDTYKTEEYLKTVSRYLTKCRLLERIHIDALPISDKIEDEDMKSICGVIEHNTSTLKSLYVDFYPNEYLKPMYKTINHSLPDMSHLVALHIKGFILPHEDFTSLCTFLSGNSRLQQISISCTFCELCRDSSYFECRNQHEVDLAKHQQLQYLECAKSVTVTHVNTSNLEIFTCESLNSTNFVKVFENISTANKLTKLYLEYDRFRSDTESSYYTVTDKLITLLPLLHQLRELTLDRFTLTDNIMKCPSEMKNLELICLLSVTMSLTTWRQFVDSLSLIPLPVKVLASFMYFTRDGEECNRGIYWMLEEEGREEEAAAWQYVREQGELFNMRNVKGNSINFFNKEKIILGIKTNVQVIQCGNERK